jgi:hypothetical protein
VRVLLDGRPVPVLSGSPRRAVIDLRDMPQGRVQVAISARRNDGTPLRQRRSYQTCVGRHTT